MTPEERKASNRAASHASWARTADRAARTANGRAAGPSSVDYWLARLDPVRFADATEAQRTAAALSARKAHFASLSAKSVRARAERKKRPSNP